MIGSQEIKWLLLINLLNLFCMKKILLFVLLVVSISGFTQTGFPGVQGMGSPTTRLEVKGAVHAIKGVINGVYVDTTAANADYIDFYNGAQIYTRSDRNLWLRDSVLNMWIRMAKFSDAGTNIYNSDGILENNRTLTGLNNTYSLTFDSLNTFLVRRDGITRMFMNSSASGVYSPDGTWSMQVSNAVAQLNANNGANIFWINADSGYSLKRISYAGNIHGTFGPYSLIDVSYLDSVKALINQRFGHSAGDDNINDGDRLADFNSTYRLDIINTTGIRLQSLDVGGINNVINLDLNGASTNANAYLTLNNTGSAETGWFSIHDGVSGTDPFTLMFSGTNIPTLSRSFTSDNWIRVKPREMLFRNHASSVIKWVNVPSTSDTTWKALAYRASDSTMKVMTYWPEGGGTTFVDNTWIMNDNVDATKQLQFQLSGISAPNVRTLTVPDASGIIALADVSNNWGEVRQTFNPGATAAGLNVGGNTGNPSTPADGDIFYEFGSNELRARINGAWVALGAGGGSGTVNPGAALKAAYYPSAASLVDDWVGVEFGNTNLNTKITAQAATEVPLEIKAASSQTVALLNVSSSSGTGDFFNIGAGGTVSINSAVENTSINSLIIKAKTANSGHYTLLANTSGGSGIFYLTNDGTVHIGQYMTFRAEINSKSVFNGTLFTNNSNGLMFGDGSATTVVKYISDATGETKILYDGAGTNTINYNLTHTYTSTGTPAAGIGVGERYQVETAAGNNEYGAIIDVVTTDVTSTSEDFDYVIKLMAAGAAASEALRVNSLKSLVLSGRSLEKQGADVASVAGAIALGTDGNSFEITGTNAITLISNLNWQNGAVITLIFTSTATLTDGTANSGTDIGLELAGNTNFVASAGATWTGRLLELGGTQRWYEISRSVQ